MSPQTMNPDKPDIAEIFRRYGPDYRAKYRKAITEEQRTVIANILRCRTAALGGCVLRCDSCGHKEIIYRSCRDRHCPKCGARARAEWLQAQAANLLPGIPYFHLVFTIPQILAAIAIQNKAVFFTILFKAVSETLQTIARDPKHLGAQIGFIALLHTWSQTLLFHPHIHCILPGGGLSLNGTEWIRCRKTRRQVDFFLPVRVLSAMFQGKMLAHLTHAYQQGELSFHGTLEGLNDLENWKRLLTTAKATSWSVHAKPPYGSTEQVLKYLARYTTRVAISNQRLVSIDHGKVTFRWRDRRNGNKLRTMALDALEFMRRFLLHVLPKGFQRIRHYGFLANCHRVNKIALCRQLLRTEQQTEPPAPPSGPPPETIADIIPNIMEKDHAPPCPACKQGRMLPFADLLPDPDYNSALTRFLAYDTS